MVCTGLVVQDERTGLERLMAVRKRNDIGSVDRISTKSESESSGRKKTVVTKVKWQDSTGGKVVIVALCVVVVAVAIIEIRSYLHGDTPGDPNSLTYICSKTGKTFKHTNVIGESIPILSPYSGENTGYPAFPCYWTASGELKKDPTWVLLNSSIGKPGPTFCPDCGRLVNPLKPLPQPGDKPPPTQDELLHSIEKH